MSHKKASVTILKKNAQTGEDQEISLAYLSRGRSFGEMAIMHESTRSATVRCDTRVAVLCIEREAFVDIFMHVDTGREPEHIVFLRRRVDVLAKWWPRGLDKLPFHNPKICFLTYFRKNYLVCANSCAQNEWIYVVKEGTCRILKALSSSRLVDSSATRSVVFPEYKHFGTFFAAFVQSKFFHA